MMCNRISRGSASVFACATGIIFATLYVARLGAEEPVADRYARIERMSPEAKDELERKRQRFLALSPEEQDRLRELHELIASSPNADQLQDTLSSYARWLANLSSAQRSKLLDIKDIDERIAQMKELMKQQEEARFNLLVGNLSREDRDAIYKWLEEFAVRHEDEIVERTKGGFRERLRRSNTPDEGLRRRFLIGAWHWQYFHREEGTPQPTPADLDELLKGLSPEGRTLIDPSLESDQRQARLTALVWAALQSRYTQPISEEDLRKFHASLSPEQRERLEGFEGEQLRSELRRMFHVAKGRSRFGGFGGPRDASRGRRDEGRDRGSDRDRNDDRNREGTRDRDDDDARRDERTTARGNEDKDCCNDNDECRGGVCRKIENGRDAKRRA